MKSDGKAKMGRRDFLRTLGAGAGAAAAPMALIGEARAGTENSDEKRKPRYKADSPDVKAFYRVNHYPS